MGDPPQHNERSDTYYRGRLFYRPPHRGRGRGRGDSRAYQVQRTLDELNVTDLRQHIDRLQEQSKSDTPSDTSYSNFKNSPRDNEGHSSKGSSNLQRSNSGRGRGRPKNEDSFIQNPMNIQVHFSPSTGERNYSVHEDSKLADIRHVPDYQLPRARSSFRGRTVRSRARGRNIGEQYEREQEVRAKSVERRRNDQRGSQVRSRSVEYRHRDSEGEHFEGQFRGRGRGSASNYYEYNRSRYPSEGHRGRGRPSEGEFRGRGRFPGGEFRGRGRSSDGEYMGRGRSSDSEFRGRGRGRGRGGNTWRGRDNQQKYSSNAEVVPPNYGDAVDENWENEEELSNKTDTLNGVSSKQIDTYSTDEAASYQQESQYDPTDESYGDPNVLNLETSFNNISLSNCPNSNEEEGIHETEIVEENKQTGPISEIVKENIVVESGENKKRTVRFNLEENESEVGETKEEKSHDLEDKKP